MYGFVVAIGLTLVVLAAPVVAAEWLDAETAGHQAANALSRFRTGKELRV